MAVWEVRVVYQTGDRFWENVWKVDVGAADDVPSALIVAFAEFAEATLLSTFNVARIVRRPAGTTDAFIETLINVAGAVAIGGHKSMPLYNTIKVLLNSGAGRPGVKYLRGLLTEADLLDSQGHIASGIVTLVQNAANDLFNVASDESCFIVEGSANTPAVSPVVQSLFQMRQQHRKRKRST